MWWMASDTVADTTPRVTPVLWLHHASEVLSCHAKKIPPSANAERDPVCTAYCRRLTRCEIDFSMLAAHIYNVVPVVAGSRVRI